MPRRVGSSATTVTSKLAVNHVVITFRQTRRLLLFVCWSAAAFDCHATWRSVMKKIPILQRRRRTSY